MITSPSRECIQFRKFEDQISIMNLEEMKLAAINEIGKLNDEDALKELLEHLAQLSHKEKELDLFRHYEKAKEQYGDVLAKLAQ